MFSRRMSSLAFLCPFFLKGIHSTKCKSVNQKEGNVCTSLHIWGNEKNAKTWKLVSLVFSAGNRFGKMHTHTHRILEGSVTQDSLSWRIVKYAGVFFNHLPIARMPHIHTVICCTSSPNEPKTCFIIIYSPFS